MPSCTESSDTIAAGHPKVDSEPPPALKRPAKDLAEQGDAELLPLSELLRSNVTSV